MERTTNFLPIILKKIIIDVLNEIFQETLVRD
jgi:hypothetical protein